MSRPKEFDKEEALRKAVMVFWRKGYDGTSLPDLIDAMGISRSSLYETFGNKESLFKEALAFYGQEQAGCRLSNALSEKKPIREIFREHFCRQIELSVDAKTPGGCFYTNTAASFETICPEVKATVKARALAQEKEFSKLLELAQKRGELRKNRDATALARMLICLSYGITVMAKTNPQRKAFEDAVDEALAAFE